MSKLNKKQAIFLREYLKDMNATRAAISAGYSKRTAAVQGSRLLRNAHIHAEIAKVAQKTCDNLEVSVEKVLKELARLAFLDPRKFYNENGGLKHVTELDDDTAACLAGMDVEDLFEFQGEEKAHTGYCRKIKFADKGANLERLGRYLKMFTDRIEHSGSIEHVDLSNLSDEELAEVQRIVESAGSSARSK